MEQLTIGFDYGVLDDDARTIVESCRDEIRRREKRAAEDIIEIGRNLIAVKEAMPHGCFESWLESEFGWTDRSARTFMRVARVFGDNGKVFQFQPSALYALASGNVPEEIREEFIAKAEAGEPVRYRDVRERIGSLRDAENDVDEEPEREPHPLLSVVDLETGEIVATAEEYAEHQRSEDASARSSASLASVPSNLIPPMREKSREEMAFDRLAAMTIITDLNPLTVADTAADFRADTARLLLRRMPVLEEWASAFADRLRERLETPLRAVR